MQIKSLIKQLYIQAPYPDPVPCMIYSPITFSSQTNKTKTQKYYKIYYVLFSYQLAGQNTISLKKKNVFVNKVFSGRQPRPDVKVF